MIRTLFLVTLICVVDVDFVGITKVVILTHVAEPRGFVKLNAYKRNSSRKSLLAT
jgi:hypothetical protein